MIVDPRVSLCREKMPEYRDLARAKDALAVVDQKYNDEMPKLESNLPRLKDAAKKKKEKDDFVNKNKAKRLKKEQAAKAAKAKQKADEKAKKAKQGGGLFGF